LSVKWNVTFRISRQKSGVEREFQDFVLEVDPNEYVLDGVERVWAFHDRSLNYRHACHHSTCGACGMRVNGVEKLTCITPIHSVTRNGGTITVEPLRNFPVISDLVVDMSRFYLAIDEAKFFPVAPVNKADLPYEAHAEGQDDCERLVDCIECGICISACPIALTTPAYIGPAPLAAAQHAYNELEDASILELMDDVNAAWRCHHAFECSAVCPSNVEPGWRIMDLRKRIMRHKIQNLLTSGK